MKTKALLVYITLGAAFAAVSLWVFFSHGKNAKAIRTKYKLGGAMIAAWVLLSASGQAPPPPEVTCYEPPSPPNEINVRPKKGGDCQLHIGDTLLVRIYDPTYEIYRVKVLSAEDESQVIQSNVFEIADKNLSVANFDLEIVETGFRGEALVEISGVKTEDEQQTDDFVGSRSISIL